jgi:hypothetical protein
MVSFVGNIGAGLKIEGDARRRHLHSFRALHFEEEFPMPYVSFVVKRQECEANHSPPSSVEVNNGGAILSPVHKFS